MTDKTLNHFAFFSFTDPFWSLPPDQRADFYLEFDRDLQGSAPCIHHYQISPVRADQDVLVWSALPAPQPTDGAVFFERLGAAINRHRRFIRPNLALWGFTKPSIYSKNPSPQEVDPLSGQRSSHLVFYPFVKTIDWYLLGRDTRQGMMNEHIRIGHQYPEIKQLLLYCFGLQDQEFIVMYETEDLSQFSDLVYEMRGAEVRRYTERDTPIYTALHRTPQQMADLLGPAEEKAQ